MIPFEIRSGTCFILYRCGDALQVRAARAGPGRNRGRAPGRPVAEHCPDMTRIMIFAGLDDLAVTEFIPKGMPVIVEGTIGPPAKALPLLEDSVCLRHTYPSPTRTGRGLAMCK